MKTLIKVIIFVAIAVGAWLGWGYWQSNQPLEIDFTTQKLTKGNLTISVDATGTLEPEELIDVGAQVGGMIIEFGKDKNGKEVSDSTQVEEGQMIARIDDVLVEIDIKKAEAEEAQAKASIASATADIAQAKAKHTQAKLNRNRAEKLGPGEALAQTAYEQYISDEQMAQASLEVAEASLLRAEASLKSAQANLQRELRNRQYTTIVSPVKGVVIHRVVNIGQTVVSSMNAPSLFLIAKDLIKMQIWSAVNEADIGQIYAGQPVQFTTDAFPGRKFTGTVNKIRLNATMSSNVVTYIVEVDVPNPDYVLYPYLTANVQFITHDYKDVFLVPNAALRYQPEMSFISEQGRNELKEIEAQIKAIKDKDPQEAKQLGIIWEEADDTAYPYLVQTDKSNGMITPIKGAKLRDDMNIITKSSIISGAEAKNEDGANGTVNPLMPTPPKRTRHNAGGPPR